jgi:hypothetical protein
MNKLSCLVATACLSAGSAWAQAQPTEPPPAAAGLVRSEAPDTLMFSIDELTEIRSRMDVGALSRGGESQTEDTIENATLYLSTILYSTPNDWTIWVNGIPIVPNQDFNSFEVTGIGPDYVELVVPLSAQGMRPVRLSPNQTFVARSGAVIEGRP